MESGQLRKLNLCYAGIQSLYWAGFAAIWAFLSVLLLYRGFSNSQIGTVSALALLMPLAVQPVLASLADRDRRFTSRRLAMALTGLLLLCAVGLWCSAGSMAVTAALYVLVGISLTATAPFHSAMAMELQQHGVALNYGLSRGLGSACYAASVLVLGVVSRGMQMKLMLACAFSHDAKLLILDEPTSGLDPLTRDEFLEILQDYIRDGQRSVLFSTHITTDLERVADYITLINRGNMIFTGSMEDLLSSYRLIKGKPCDLTADLEKNILGLRKTAMGFEGLITANAAVQYKHCVLDTATIDDIIICIGKGGTKA